MNVNSYYKPRRPPSSSSRPEHDTCCYSSMRNARIKTSPGEFLRTLFPRHQAILYRVAEHYKVIRFPWLDRILKHLAVNEQTLLLKTKSSNISAADSGVRGCASGIPPPPHLCLIYSLAWRRLAPALQNMPLALRELDNQPRYRLVFCGGRPQ